MRHLSETDELSGENLTAALANEMRVACLGPSVLSKLANALVSLQYSDFAAWQRQELDERKVATQIGWW